LLQVDGEIFHLAAPDPSEGAAPLPRLPPRLAKIAKMVIAGSTDKQIARSAFHVPLPPLAALALRR
jgi:DNA-binding NarL/FixJ family response regulator